MARRSLNPYKLQDTNCLMSAAIAGLKSLSYLDIEKSPQTKPYDFIRCDSLTHNNHYSKYTSYTIPLIIVLLIIVLVIIRELAYNTQSPPFPPYISLSHKIISTFTMFKIIPIRDASTIIGTIIVSQSYWHSHSQCQYTTTNIIARVLSIFNCRSL